MGFHREESDMLGIVRVPSKAIYGAFTTRAMENFNVSCLRIDEEFIVTLAEVKKASAQANGELDL